MVPQSPRVSQVQVEAFGRRHRTELVTLVFTDMVGSTALKQQLGDHAGAQLIERHHALVRATLHDFPNGEELSTSGDSFFLVFATPSAGVKFALVLQQRLQELNRQAPVPLQDRMGLHLGEVLIQEAGQQRPKDLIGLNVDLGARVMGLAQGGQILLTRAVFDSARQSLKGEEVEGVGFLSWLNHGRFKLQGVDEPLEICEVRCSGAGAIVAPATSGKARRVEAAEGEAVLGWRPAVGEVVPNTQWLLERKLGEGGFGEVWLGQHQTLKERRVFKFCFRADRVRSLKREMTLFRVLKERIGDHPHIVRLLEVYFEEPPFYVVMDHVEGEDLKTWCERQGGAETVSLKTRLEIVAQIADALQAAHDAGVIHRDVKPTNILVSSSKSEVRPALLAKLTDFGIGQVVSAEALKGVTKAGFTQTIVAESSSSQTGSQMYMAPELLAGKPATTRSDIYSLGVVLFQLLVGDFERPVTTDWQEEVTDPLLRDDLKHCFAGNLQDRFAGAGQLAKNLRAWEQRKMEVARQRAQQAERERLREQTERRQKLLLASGAAGLVLVALALALGYGMHKAQAEREQQKRLLYGANMNLAQQAWEQNNVGRVRQLLEDTAAYPHRGFEWNYWQRQTHLELKTLYGHSDKITSVAFSPDGQRIVTGSDDGTAKVWEAASGKELLTLKGHSAGVMAVAFSPDGRRIVTGSDDQTAKLWEAASGKELLTLRGHSVPISSVAFSPDGQRIATGSYDQTAKVWEASSGKELLTLKGHVNGVLSLAFSADGQRIVTGSADQTAKVWEAAGGKELLTLKGHSNRVWSVAFSPDGQRIATGSYDQTAKVWEASNGKELLTLRGHSNRVLSVAFSPDGQRIVTGSDDQTARVWEAANGKELLALRGHSNRVLSAAFSPDGQRIVTGSLDQTAKVWEASSGRELLTLKGHINPVLSVAFSPDGQRIATSSYDQTAKVWEASSGKGLLTFKGHGAPVLSVAFSPDGQRMVTGGADGTAKVWEAVNGKEVFTLKGHSNWVRSVAFSPDSQRIVTGSSDQTAKVWEASSGKELLTLKGHTDWVRSVAFSPDGQRIATASYDHTAKVWEASSGKELLTLKGHVYGVLCVAFSPDGWRIVTGSQDGTAKVCEALSGKELLTLKGHVAAVSSIAFSSDGERIVTGSEDGTAKVWEALSGKELLTLKGQVAGVSSVAFSPDGQRIVTGSQDGTAKVWEAATSRQVAAWQRDEKAAAEHLAPLRRERAVAAERERALRAQDPGAIKHWLVLAPIAFEGRSGAAALQQEFIPQEGGLRPKAGERVKMGQSERIWREVQLEDYLIDFNQLLGEQTDWSVAYVVCYIQSEAHRTGLLVKVGSDDQAKIYLNGREIYRNDAARMYVPDEEVIAGVELKAGLNVLVFKVVNETMDWQASVRFTDAAGQPVKGIRVTLTPP